MSGLIRLLTSALFLLPFGLLAGAFLADAALAIPAALLLAGYLWVWLRFRPLRFEVHPAAIDVVWPLKRRRIARDGITEARRVDAAALRGEVGRCARVGAGGLWGGFGWLWTQRRGIVQMYVSRTDEFVWIDRGGERAWLITPERPDEFVRLLATGASP